MKTNKLMALLFTLAPAASALAGKEMKIAMVDMQKIVQDYNKTAELSSRFDEEVASRRKLLADQAEEVQKLQADYEKTKSALNAKAQKDKEYIITKKAEDFERNKQKMTEELDKKRSDLNDLLMQEIKTEIEKQAKSSGYDIVYDKAAFLYTKEGAAVDITATVLASLEKQNAASKK